MVKMELDYIMKLGGSLLTDLDKTKILLSRIQNSRNRNVAYTVGSGYMGDVYNSWIKDENHLTIPFENSIKIWSDISNVSMKYGFLKKIGMETKEIKKNVKKELSLSLWIVFILSIVISGGALSYITWNVDWLLKKQVLITFFVLLLFQAGYIILLREYGWRLVKQQIQGERREKIWK